MAEEGSPASRKQTIMALRSKAVASSNGPSFPTVDTKAMSRDISDEVDERVRNGSKASGLHCERLVVKADEIALQDLKESKFMLSPNPAGMTNLCVYVKAKTLKRLLAKIAVLAEVCSNMDLAPTDNMCVWNDWSWRSEIEFSCETSKIRSKVDGQLGRTGSMQQVGVDIASTGVHVERNLVSFRSKLDDNAEDKPIMIPIDTSEVTRDKISSSTHSQKLLQDGSLYKGEMRDGRPHGYGSIVYSDTDPKQRIRFVGDFVDGIRTGSGCISWMDGTHYSGEWYGDRPSGFGMEVYPDGSSFAGQYLDDLRQGWGMYIFPSGAKYKGHWEDGVRGGLALEHSKRGIFASEFSQGKRTSSKDYIPGEKPEMDKVTAKVISASERGREKGERSMQAYEKYFQVKLGRGNLLPVKNSKLGEEEE